MAESPMQAGNKIKGGKVYEIQEAAREYQPQEEPPLKGFDSEKKI